jgi:hypothetical protein
MKRRLPVVGDYVGFIFAQPGNDTTYAKVLREGGKGLICYDPWFNFEFDAAPIDEPGNGGVWLLLEPDRPVVSDGGAPAKSVVAKVQERIDSGEFEARTRQ